MIDVITQLLEPFKLFDDKFLNDANGKEFQHLDQEADLLSAPDSTKKANYHAHEVHRSKGEHSPAVQSPRAESAEQDFRRPANILPKKERPPVISTPSEAGDQQKPAELKSALKQMDRSPSNQSTSPKGRSPMTPRPLGESKVHFATPQPARTQERSELEAQVEQQRRSAQEVTQKAREEILKARSALTQQSGMNKSFSGRTQHSALTNASFSGSFSSKAGNRNSDPAPINPVLSQPLKELVPSRPASLPQSRSLPRASSTPQIGSGGLSTPRSGTSAPSTSTVPRKSRTHTF